MVRGGGRGIAHDEIGQTMRMKTVAGKTDIGQEEMRIGTMSTEEAKSTDLDEMKIAMTGMVTVGRSVIAHLVRRPTARVIAEDDAEVMILTESSQHPLDED